MRALFRIIIKLKTDTMYGLQLSYILGFQVLPYFRNEHIHAPAKEVIVLAPNAHQYLVPFKHTVGIKAQKPYQVRFPLRKLMIYFFAAECKISIIKKKIADLEYYRPGIIFLFASFHEYLYPM